MSYTVHVCELCTVELSQKEEEQRRSYEIQRWGYVHTYGISGPHNSDSPIFCCSECLRKIRGMIHSLKPRFGA
jgi:hypothetical protein